MWLVPKEDTNWRKKCTMVEHVAIHTIYKLKILHWFFSTKFNNICNRIKHWIKMVLVRTNQLFKPQNLTNFVLAITTKQISRITKANLCDLFKYLI